MQQSDEYDELAQQLGRALLNVFKQMQQTPMSDSVPPLELPDTGGPQRDMLRSFSEEDPTGLHTYQVEQESHGRPGTQAFTRLLEKLTEKSEMESRYRNTELDMIEDILNDLSHDHIRLEALWSAYSQSRRTGWDVNI